MSLILLLARAPSTYVLTQEAGDFALSGQQAGLLSGWMLSANTGSFLLTGNDADFRYFNMPVGAGSFTFTGNDVVVSKGFTLAADVGGYTLTGQDVFLTADPILVAEPYTRQVGGGLLLALVQSVPGFIVAANAVGIAATRFVTAEAASFSLTGNEVALPVSMPADGTSFTLSFNDASIYATRFVLAETGTYTLTGIAAGLSSAWSSQVDLFRTRQTFTADAMFTRDR